MTTDFTFSASEMTAHAAHVGALAAQTKTIASAASGLAIGDVNMYGKTPVAGICVGVLTAANMHNQKAIGALADMMTAYAEAMQQTADDYVACEQHNADAAQEIVAFLNEGPVL